MFALQSGILYIIPLLLLLLLHTSDRRTLHVFAETSGTTTKFSPYSTRVVEEKASPSTREYHNRVTNKDEHDDRRDDVYVNNNNHELIFRGLGDDDLCPFSFPDYFGANSDDTTYSENEHKIQQNDSFHFVECNDNLTDYHHHDRIDRILRRLKAEHDNHTTQYKFSLVPVVSVLIPRLLSFSRSITIEGDVVDDDLRPRSDQSSMADVLIPTVDDLTGRWKPVVTTEFLNQLDDFWVSSCKAKKNKSSDPMCTASTWYRRVVLRGVVFYRELIRHVHNDDDDDVDRSNRQSLELVATNPITSWNRTLHSSPHTSPFHTEDRNGHQDCRKQIINHLNDPRTNETILVKAFWSSDGKTHTSILWYNEDDVDMDGSIKSTKLVVEEIFPRWETKRYLLHQVKDPLDNDQHQTFNDVLVSESILHYRNDINSDLSTTSSEERAGTVTVVWTYVRD